MNQRAIDLSEDVPLQIVEAVAEKEGVSCLELPPLYETIDPDQIASLPLSSTVEFQYCGYTVSVQGDGTVTIEKATDDPAPHA